MSANLLYKPLSLYPNQWIYIRGKGVPIGGSFVGISTSPNTFFIL